MKKRFTCFILVLVMFSCLLSSFSVAHAGMWDNLAYSILNDEVYITHCDRDSVTAEIPEEIDGYPVTTIYSDAFRNCRDLVSVIIPNNIKSLPLSCFEGCISLKSITIPGSISSTGSWTFNGCTALETVIILDGVSSIGLHSFQNCTSLKNIIIPDSVTTIYSNAFDGCTSLESIKLPNGITSINNSVFKGCVVLKSVVIPESVKTISISSFKDCVALESIMIPESVTLISGNAFDGCISLKSIVFSSAYITLGGDAFKGCVNLSEITVPDTAVKIPDKAFKGCTNLRKLAVSSIDTVIEKDMASLLNIKVVYIPKETTCINSNAFGTGVEYVYYGGSEEDKQNLVISEDNDSLNNATWVYDAAGLPECTFDNDCDTECNRCGIIREITHKYGEYIYNNDATTEKDGTKTKTCSVCGKKATIKEPGSKLPVPDEKPVEIIDTSKIFTDVKAGKWYTNAVNYAYSYGFIAGVGETEFGRDVPVTRGMFITILARISGVNTSGVANKVNTKFSDVKSGKYYTAAIKWASENGIVNGITQTTFAPDSSIERQQLCVMIVNFAKFKQITISQKENEIKFSDANGIAKYAKDAVKLCQTADIVNGYDVNGGTQFRAKNTATRAEAAQILYKFHKDFVA